MYRRMTVFLTLMTILALFVPACTRSASQSPLATATEANTVNYPVGTQPSVKPEQQTSAAKTPSAVETAEPTEEPPTVTPTHKPTATPGRPNTYTLKTGEWPVCIARRFNLDIEKFFKANNLNMQSRLNAGTVLTIPDSGTWNAASYGPRALHEHPTTYNAAAGETAQSIACYFGDVYPEAIFAENNLNPANGVQAGQTLKIP